MTSPTGRLVAFDMLVGAAVSLGWAVIVVGSGLGCYVLLWLML